MIQYIDHVIYESFILELIIIYISRDFLNSISAKYIKASNLIQIENISLNMNSNEKWKDIIDVNIVFLANNFIDIIKATYLNNY